MFSLATLVICTYSNHLTPSLGFAALTNYSNQKLYYFCFFCSTQLKPSTSLAQLDSDSESQKSELSQTSGRLVRLSRFFTETEPHPPHISRSTNLLHLPDTEIITWISNGVVPYFYRPSGRYSSKLFQERLRFGIP